MIASDNLPIDYEVGSKRFILSKSEIRCVDSAAPDSNFSVALNEINPNFFHQIAVSPFFVIATLYLVIGSIVRSVQLLTGSIDVTSSDAGQLAFFLALLGYTIYRGYRGLRHAFSYHFSGLFDNKIVCSIPFTRQTKQKALAFMDAMIKRIRECPPSNDSVISLLSWYQLISQIEWSQLDASIKQNEIVEKNKEPVIINLMKHKK